jgi:glyoxalase-like protein
MPRSALDHIIIVAPSLDEGSEHVRRVLGVAPQPGGEHVRMGTHNRLLKLGERMYLEVIAVNPRAPDPGRPRWFGMDAPVKECRLATWVVRTNHILAAVAASRLPLGKIELMSRGRFDWQITVTDDGGLPLDGIAPTIIQWRDAHPMDGVPDSGCSLERLEGFHPRAEEVRRALDAIGFDGRFSVAVGEPARLAAHIRTPAGLRTLE